MDVAKLSGISSGSHDQLRDITRRLCYFGAQGSQTYVQELEEFLVLNSLAKLPPGGQSPGKIRKKLTEIIGFSLEFEQVFGALQRLQQKETIYAVDTHSDKAIRFGLPVETTSELIKKYKEQIEFENNIVDAWKAQLKVEHTELSDEELDLLQEDLEIFSLRLFSMHSIESVSLYYGEDENVAKLLNELNVQSISELLPARSEKLNKIRMRELPEFFKNAPLDRKRYIGQQLNRIFLLHMVQLDPTCAKLVSEHITGGVLFLDTNFLMRLFGIDGEDLQVAAKRLLELSKGLGYRAAISPRTLEEYQFKIDNLLGKGGSMHPINPTVAEAALSTTCDRNCYTNYWMRVRSLEKGVSRQGFWGIFKEVQEFLEAYDIKVNKEGDSAIRGNPTALLEEESLLGRCLPEYDAHPSIVEHDAHHRLLILHLRAGYEEKSPLEVPYWFLTCDTKLPVYDRRARARDKLKVPFCVLSTHWMQLLAPFSSAVEGFDILQADSLDSALFRIFPTPSSGMVQDIIDRMTASEKIPPSVMVKVITNQTFVRAFGQENDPAERDNMLYDAALDAVGELLEETEEKMRKEQKELSEKTRETIEKERRDSLQQINDLNLRCGKLEEELKNTEEDRSAYLMDRKMLEEKCGRLDTEHSEVIRELKTSLKEKQEMSLQKDQLERLSKEVEARFEKVIQEGCERNKTNQEALAKLKEELCEERSKHEGEIADLKRSQSRLKKFVLFFIVWLSCAAAFIILKPLLREGSTWWLGLTFITVSVVLTQMIFILGAKVRTLFLILLVCFDILAVISAILLPLGYPIGGAFLWMMTIPSYAGGVLVLYQEFTKKSLGGLGSGHGSELKCF
jgi:predicted nucleic acid-binding protein/uncharacterized membrane protein